MMFTLNVSFRWQRSKKIANVEAKCELRLNVFQELQPAVHIRQRRKSKKKSLFRSLSFGENGSLAGNKMNTNAIFSINLRCIYTE